MLFRAVKVSMFRAQGLGFSGAVPWLLTDRIYEGCYTGTIVVLRVSWLKGPCKILAVWDFGTSGA